MILDSHFHFLSMKRKGLDALPDDLIGIDAGTDSGDAASRIAILPQSRSIFISIGSGPWVLDNENYISPEDEMERILADYRTFGADAIGECGFDNHWKYGTKEAQKELFMIQAEIASELSLPIIIHTRDADAEISEAISSPSFRCRGIMHCFSSDTALMKKALDKGLYISFAGNVTYKSNTKIQEAARSVPIDRILYETDSPYLSPVPMRGKPCSPGYTEYTLDFLSAIRKEDREKIKEAAIKNLYDVLQRKESVRKLSIS